MIPHQRLLLKVSHCGTAVTVLAWIEDFIHGRTQNVILEGQSSSWATVASGVPQGSILGPLLFLICMNDLPDCIPSSTVRLLIQPYITEYHHLLTLLVFSVILMLFRVGSASGSLNLTRPSVRYYGLRLSTS